MYAQNVKIKTSLKLGIFKLIGLVTRRDLRSAGSFSWTTWFWKES